MTVRAHYEPIERCVRLHRVAEPFAAVVWVSREPPAESLAALDDDEAQRLMDDLFACGFRPSAEQRVSVAAGATDRALLGRLSEAYDYEESCGVLGLSVEGMRRKRLTDARWAEKCERAEVLHGRRQVLHSDHGARAY
mgnify:CR=1 FL=1